MMVVKATYVLVRLLLTGSAEHQSRKDGRIRTLTPLSSSSSTVEMPSSVWLDIIYASAVELMSHSVQPIETVLWS